MKKLVNFFHEIGKLKEIPRRGLVLIGMKDPASIMDHSYRMALMVWVLGRKKRLNMERAIKMALSHDLCEIYSNGLTPYDHGSGLPKDKKEWPKLFDSLPRFSKSQKIKNFLKKNKKEQAALIKLTKGLPDNLAKEIINLWQDYEKGTSKEARFVRQINRLETLFQAFEHGKKIKRRPYHSWWVGSEEHIDDPLLKEFMLEMGNNFYQKPKKKTKSKIKSKKTKTKKIVKK